MMVRAVQTPKRPNPKRSARDERVSTRRDPDGMSAGHKGAALEVWMTTHDGFDPNGVTVRWLGPARGYAGVATKRAVKAGETLVKVPRSAMLTAEEAQFCRGIGRAARRLNEWQALTLKLLYERDRYLDESSLGGSQWDEWLEMLPTVEQMKKTHPLLWSADKRRKLLKGSPTLDKLETMIEAAVMDRDLILEALGVDVRGYTKATAWPSLYEVLWASAIMYSRSFQLSSQFTAGPSDVQDINLVAVPTAPKEEVFGEQVMVQRGALWWSVEENLEENELYDDDYDDEDELGAWGDFDSEDEDDWFDQKGFVPFPISSSVDSGDDKASFDDYDYKLNSMQPGFFEHEGSFLALVPWADALNHDVSSGARAVITYDAEKGFAECRAASSFPVGSEVTISYEPGISRQDLFLNYGFVAARNPPREGVRENEDVIAPPAEDVVDVSSEQFLDVAEEVLCGATGNDGDRDRESLAALRSYLNAVGMAKTTLRVTASGADEKAMEWCQLAVASRSEMTAVGWKPKDEGASDDESPDSIVPDSISSWIVLGKLRLDEDGPDVESAKRARRERANRVLSALCAKYLAGYPSAEKLAEMAGEDGLSEGEEQPEFGAPAVARLLQSEKRALLGAIEAIDREREYFDVSPPLRCDLPE